MYIVRHPEGAYYKARNEWTSTPESARHFATAVAANRVVDRMADNGVADLTIVPVIGTMPRPVKKAEPPKPNKKKKAVPNDTTAAQQDGPDHY